MPNVPKPAGANVKNARVPQGQPDPKEIASIQKSIVGTAEQAPSTRQSSAPYQQWSTLANAPPDPFSTERIPVNRLKQMRRDPMIGFGLSFIRTPLLRAPWFIQAIDSNGPNGQVAAFVDYALRRIISSLINQYCNSLSFGFSAIAKRFSQEPIMATYWDDVQKKELPIWSEGNIDPIIWKPFVPLPPDEVEPLYDNSTGEFNGIKYTPAVQVAATQGASPGKQEGTLEIDVYHSLWATNEKESMFNNIFGYPRIGYAYQYWYSSWWLEQLINRHFEKDADPPTIVRHPIGEYVDETGTRVNYGDLALAIGDQARSGSTIAIPSEPYVNFEDRPSAVQKWQIEFLTGGGNFGPFQERFNYLDTMKLRSLWVPEQALIEGSGGTSSRNVADTFGQALQDSQAVLMQDIDDHINRFVIPQLVATNFPEFIGTVTKVTQGFASSDLDTMRQVIQLVGQAPDGGWRALGVDVRKALESLGVPVLSPEEQAQKEAEAAKLAAAAGPQPVQPQPGKSVGVVPTGGQGAQAPGNTNANTPSGFADQPWQYVQPAEKIWTPIYLADNSMDFLNSLPASDHYTDKLIRGYAQQIWQEWFDNYRTQFADFTTFLAANDLGLSDEERLELSGADTAKAIANRIVRAWQGNSAAWLNLATRTKDLFKRVLNRAGFLELSKTGLSAEQWDASQQTVNDWLDAHIASTLSSVNQTIRDELRDQLVRSLHEGKNTPEELSATIQEHFSDFPQWMADRLARTEIRDLYNGATLLAGRQLGIEQVQALDALKGPTDPDCEQRDGTIFKIDAALKEREHPNGTLLWRLLPQPVTVAASDDRMYFDPESRTLFLSDKVDDVQRRQFLRIVGEKLSHA